MTLCIGDTAPHATRVAKLVDLIAIHVVPSGRKVFFFVDFCIQEKEITTIHET